MISLETRGPRGEHFTAQGPTRRQAAQALHGQIVRAGYVLERASEEGCQTQPRQVEHFAEPPGGAFVRVCHEARDGRIVCENVQVTKHSEGCGPNCGCGKCQTTFAENPMDRPIKQRPGQRKTLADRLVEHGMQPAIAKRLDGHAAAEAVRVFDDKDAQLVKQSEEDGDGDDMAESAMGIRYQNLIRPNPSPTTGAYVSGEDLITQTYNANRRAFEQRGVQLDEMLSRFRAARKTNSKLTAQQFLQNGNRKRR